MKNIFENGWTLNECNLWESSLDNSHYEKATPSKSDRGDSSSDQLPLEVNEIKFLTSNDQYLKSPLIDLLQLVFLTLTGIGVPCFLAMHFQGLQIPHNDTWAFEPISIHFAATGHLILNSWEAMTFAGQVIWSYPFLKIFGSNTYVLDSSVAVLALLGLLSEYFLARRLLSASNSFLVVLSTFTYWGLIYSTVNYMTDIPALSFSFICIYAGVKYRESVHTQRYVYFSIFLLSGIGGFATRQTAIAAALAVFSYLIVSDRKFRKIHIGAFAMFLAVSGALLLYIQQIKGFVPLVIKLPNVAEIGTLFKSFNTLALMIAPVTFIWCSRTINFQNLKEMKTELLIGSGSLLTLMIIFRSEFFLGNYYSQIGLLMNQTMGGARPLLFPGMIWITLIIISSTSSLMLIVFLSLRIRGIKNKIFSGNAIVVTNTLGILTFFALFSSVLLALTIFSGQSTFDRFLWPIAVALSIVILSFSNKESASNKISNRITQFITVALLLISFLATTNVFAFEQAQWNAGNFLVNSGYPAKSIDSGFDWMGSHEGFIDLKCAAGSRGGSMPYDPCFPGPQLRAVVFSSKQSITPYTTFIKALPYYKYGFFDKQYLYLYKLNVLP